MRKRRFPVVPILIVALLLVGLFGLVPQGQTQTIDPYYSGDYSFTDLGSIAGVPPLYGGLTFLAGDPNTLLIGGNANTSLGSLYSVGVVRGAGGHITGFSSPATFFADAAYNDGGVVYGPGGVLFLARWPVNELGQTKPGSSVTDKIIDMTPFGVESSLAALNFVPTGFPGAGKMKLVTWAGGQWSEATLAPDGSGTYDVSSVTLLPASNLPGGPEGFVYIPTASPLFGTPSMLISEYSAGEVASYILNANGDPIVASRRTFMAGLSGAEGAVLDPITGDFLFSTFGGGDRIIVVQGFAPAPAAVPEPSSLAVLGMGLAGWLGVYRRRRR